MPADTNQALLNHILFERILIALYNSLIIYYPGCIGPLTCYISSPFMAYSRQLMVLLGH